VKNNSFIDSIDLSSRRKRRAATKLAIRLVGLIHLAEFQYVKKIPPDFHGSSYYIAADEALDCLVQAIILLEYAYDE